MKTLRWVAGTSVLRFVVLHELGAREAMGVLSLSAPPGLSVASAAVLAMLYFSAYVGAIVLAPTVVVATVLRAGVRRFESTRSRLRAPHAD